MAAIVALFLILGLHPAPARAAPTHITAELVAEGPAGPGETVTLAFRMVPEKGWHGYWLNPGDAGQGMSVEWTLPAGTQAGALDYPVPGTLVIAGLMNHVYEHEYAVLVPLTLPRDARVGQVLPVRVKAQWLACSDTLCVPESGELATSVTVGAKGRGDPRFDGWRQALPAPLGSEGRFELTEKTVRIAIPFPAGVRVDEPHLFLGTERVVDYAANQTFAAKGDLMLVEIPRATFQPLSPDRLTALLRFNTAGDGVQFEAMPGKVGIVGKALATSGPLVPNPSLPGLLFAALIGGLLLNVMPCVFPILSLKALSLARAGESEAQARAEGLAYTAGVVIACLALGGLMLALRAAGAEIGWAFQLQEPLVVAGLLLLAVAITANLLGLYELAIPGFARAGSPQGAFATGLLAAFVATPCTGPFMAAAMGAALLMPVGPALALFTALGLGIALPFLAIAFVPALRRRLPRPGAWMVRFRRILALPMGLTGLALVWLAVQLAGSDFALAAVLLGLILICALVLLGRRQRNDRSAGPIPWFIAALLLGGALGLPGTVRTAASSPTASLLPTESFSEAALAKARASGKPVFVYFTADWCLTCKVNEKVGIEREQTRVAFARGGVKVLRGDWTRRDPAITRFLTQRGVAGVPLYLWYPAGGGEAEQLPQVLGPASLSELVK